MIVLCLVLIGARDSLVNMSHSVLHIIFSLGFVLLFVGAMAEAFREVN